MMCLFGNALTEQECAQRYDQIRESDTPYVDPELSTLEISDRLDFFNFIKRKDDKELYAAANYNYLANHGIEYLDTWQNNPRKNDVSYNLVELSIERRDIIGLFPENDPINEFKAIFDTILYNHLLDNTQRLKLFVIAEKVLEAGKYIEKADIMYQESNQRQHIIGAEDSERNELKKQERGGKAFAEAKHKVVNIERKIKDATAAAFKAASASASAAPTSVQATAS